MSDGVGRQEGYLFAPSGQRRGASLGRFPFLPGFVEPGQVAGRARNRAGIVGRIETKGLAGRKKMPFGVSEVSAIEFDAPQQGAGLGWHPTMDRQQRNVEGGAGEPGRVVGGSLPVMHHCEFERRRGLVGPRWRAARLKGRHRSS